MKSALAMGYGVVLFILGMVASVATVAFAQGPTSVEMDPVLVDLSTLGLPGALVIVAWMYKDVVGRFAGCVEDMAKSAAEFLKKPHVVVYTPNRRSDENTGEYPIP